MTIVRRFGRGLALASLVAVAVSCGGSRAFVSAAVSLSAGPMRLLAPLPRSAGPGLGPAHAFFLDSRRGYVATTGGAWYVPKTGVQPPLVPR